jgi:hypothetical protein
VAIHGVALEALTGDDTFRISLGHCSLAYEGRKILVRDEHSALVIWSDDDGFLHTLERAQDTSLTRQVRRLRARARLRRLLTWVGSVALAVLATCAGAVPVTRWAVASNFASIADWIGDSATERLALPSGIAPEVEGALATLAERLRPASMVPTRSFRVLLAGDSEAYSFDFPPGTVVVTAGLVCAAKEPHVLMKTVALELAHLERHDVSQRVAEAVDFRTALALAQGDVTILRTRMLAFADPARWPGYTPEQTTAAARRAEALLETAPAAQASLDWAKVRAEACELVGR